MKKENLTRAVQIYSELNNIEKSMRQVSGLLDLSPFNPEIDTGEDEDGLLPHSGITEIEISRQGYLRTGKFREVSLEIDPAYISFPNFLSGFLDEYFKQLEKIKAELESQLEEL